MNLHTGGGSGGLTPPPVVVDTVAMVVVWLDQKFAQGNLVLYVAFGSQAEISSTQLTQLKEIAGGLEESKVILLWVVRKSGTELGEKFEDRIKEIVDSSTQLPFVLAGIKETCRRIRISYTC
ncbi:Glycosyltransferase [Forsythia ovata]|uniref:Glycosyltransferase n=1 Tax=Forsythia ovata TaxID=205694 RepID=A0ABD1RIE1_9LAMI